MRSAPTPSPIRTCPRRPGPGRDRRILVAVVALVALVATACGGGPGTREEFNEVLTRGVGLNQDEADCISGEVFDRYGDDEDALGKLSAAPSVEFLESEEGIAGFSEFFDTAVQSCLQVGPSN